MNFSVFTIPPFDKQIKRLSKKYPSLKLEFSELLQSLQKNPNQGEPLGNNCYKIRISIGSKGKGKSGGARVITYLKVTETSVYLISIYDKSETQDISDNLLSELLNRIK
jgi:mRNA-degrading endonuclease RelE of RelBE toxin-antitoxin system